MRKFTERATGGSNSSAAVGAIRGNWRVASEYDLVWSGLAFYYCAWLLVWCLEFAWLGAVACLTNF